VRMPELARRYQDRIDKTFPRGVIISAEDERQGKSSMTYAVPRPVIVSMHGFSPVVFLAIPENDRSMSGTLAGWELVQEAPCKVVRVILDMGQRGRAHDEVQRWSANLSGTQARALSDERTDSLRCSREDKVYQGRDWEFT
jgi:hypothetical protein